MTEMLLIYIVIAAFIGWIWIDYYRLIHVYTQKDLPRILAAFFLGAASMFIVVIVRSYGLLSFLPAATDGTFLGDFVFCFVKISLLEELVKLIPYAAIFLLFRQRFKEPIDYIAYAAIVALGFSATENILFFLNNQGAEICSRTILNSVGHMFYTSFIAYGIVLIKFRQMKPVWPTIAAFILLAVLCHTYYDFWFLYLKPETAALLSIPFFLINISWFATILNNALNNESTFTYKRTINSDTVLTRLVMYYGLVVIIEFLVNTYQGHLDYAIYSFVLSTYMAMPVVGGVTSRLSRFTLIQGRWQPLRLELPFAFPSGGIGFTIKGGEPCENILNEYYEEYFTIHPISARAYINTIKVVYIERKLFLQDDEALQVLRVFKDDTRQAYDLYTIKPKTKGDVWVDDKYPIAALYHYKDTTNLDLNQLSSDDFGFIEWVYIKPLAN